MSKLSEKLAYLKGLMEGMNLKEKEPETKIISGILEAMELANERLDYLEDKADDMDDYINEIDHDLGDLEDFVAGDDEDECCCHDHDLDDYDEEDEDVSYECPECGAEVELDPDKLMAEDEPKCPECGASMFTEE
ncbi:MAG: hypothetical protein SPI49_07895 [Eubacteriales bacterium]|nr:hypothetical protein [Eubacteriales bacterium]